MHIPREIYMVLHTTTGRMYIGSSKNAHHRFKQHLELLKYGKHHVEDMQNDYDGPGNYSLSILDKVTLYEERNKEYEWMKKYNSHIRGIGYNYKDIATVQLGKKKAV